MTQTEMTALAMLKGGASYAEAAQRTGLKLEQLVELWQKHKAEPR